MAAVHAGTAEVGEQGGVDVECAASPWPHAEHAQVSGEKHELGACAPERGIKRIARGISRSARHDLHGETRGEAFPWDAYASAVEQASRLHRGARR